LFLTTSRSARVITVLLTQNVPNYLSVLSRAEVDSLLGKLLVPRTELLRLLKAE
jgi:hypothetical protein